MSAIETYDLTRVYKPEGIVGLDSLEFKLKKGEIFAFLGPNGAGKTTTIRLLACLLEPTRGSAYVSGYEVTQNPLEIRKLIGILPERPNVYERLTARRNLEYFARMYDVPPKVAQQRIKEYAELFKLSDRMASPVGTYSKGMKQKLGILRAIIHNPEILFLDEPTSGLDPIAAKTVHDLIINLAKTTDVTIIMCTHNLPEADKIADRIGVINYGKLLTTGTPHELKNQLAQTQQLYIRLVEGRTAVKKTLLDFSGVSNVQFENKAKTRIRVTLDNYERTVPSIIQELARGFKILEVKRVENTLEDVYMDLVKEKGGS